MQRETPLITAQELFDAYQKHRSIEDVMINQLLRAAGVAPEKSIAGVSWPCEDITYDGYDESFEFKNVPVGWSPPDDFDAKVKSMGFDRYWLCFVDGTEYSSNAARLRAEICGGE